MGNEEGLNSCRFSTSITRLSCQDENGFFSCLCYALRNTLQWSEITSGGAFLFKNVSFLASLFGLKCKDLHYNLCKVSDYTIDWPGHVTSGITCQDSSIRILLQKWFYPIVGSFDFCIYMNIILRKRVREKRVAFLLNSLPTQHFCNSAWGNKTHCQYSMVVMGGHALQ